MKFTCWSDFCSQLEDCDCGSNCCRGVLVTPMIITYVSDYEIKHNNPHLDYDVEHEEIVDLVMHHICPYCKCYVEV